MFSPFLQIGVLKDATVAKLPNSEVRLFLEVHFRQENQPIAPWNTKEDILLFFKLYDPEKEDLRYVGNFFVKASGKPSDIVERLNQIAGFLSDEDIELYEEIKFEPVVMCVPIESNASFRSSQIDNGDIICYQKHCLPDSMDRYRYPTVPSFFEYIHNRQIVHFRLLEKPKEEGFSLELSKCSTYDDVVEKVAKQLRMDDPSKIRLTQHNPSSQQPKPHFIKYRSLNYLSDMLHNHNQMCDILYYDILDIPLPELESMRSLKVAFQNAANHEMSFHIMRLPKSNSLLDLIEDLKSKVEISCNDAEFRFFGVYLHKICKVYQPGDKIDSVNDHGPLYIEEVPEDEKNAGPHDRLVHVYHFEYNHHIQYFGEPFFFLIRDGEALSDMKVRIQKRLQVPDEQFLKWKFAHVTFSKPEYLQDSDIVMNRFHKQRPVYGGWEQHLGLEHTATTPKRSYLGNNQNRHSFEKPVRIYN